MTRKLMIGIWIGLWIVILVSGFAMRGAGNLQDPSTKQEKEKDITPPQMIEKVLPKYPEECKKEKITGVVILEAVISKEGRTSDIKAVKSPDPRLSAAAIEAVKQWKFKPAVNKKGEPLQVVTTLTLKFALK